MTLGSGKSRRERPRGRLRGWRALLRADRGDTRTDYAASAGMLTLSGIAGTVLISATTGQAVGPAGEAAVEQAAYNGPQQYGGCDATEADLSADYENGRIPTGVLCELQQPGDYLRADAGAAFLRMSDAYEEEFGAPITVNSAYRTYARQQELYASMAPGMAASPGTSNHGLGLAVDIGSMGQWDTPQYHWMLSNSGQYGWFQPENMQQGGSGPPEPWHWEFATGVSA
ncbi:hypothetical protein GCM10027440_19150 [Nocardiopsis coralliicola]